MRRALLAHPTRYPGAALRLIEDELDASGRGPRAVARCSARRLALIEERPSPRPRTRCSAGSRKAARSIACSTAATAPRSSVSRCAILLRQWKSSDRFLFPALEAAERLGLADEAAAIRNARKMKAERMFDGVGQMAEDAELPVMTRATFERLSKELERMERELRTTIPRDDPEGARARRSQGERGISFREGQAGERQQDRRGAAAAPVARTFRRRHRSDGRQSRRRHRSHPRERRRDVLTYWILGEDEHHHGAHVISFQAPVGRALLGHVDRRRGRSRRRRIAQASIASFLSSAAFRLTASKPRRRRARPDACPPRARRRCHDVQTRRSARRRVIPLHA